MRQIPSELLDKLKSEEYIPAIFLDMTVAGNFAKFTTWSQPIFFTNFLYQPRGMEVGSITYGAANIVSGCSIEVEDVDRYLYAILGSSAAEDWTFNLYLAVLDDVGNLVEPNAYCTLFVGVVSEWSYVPGKISLRATSILSKWAKVTTRLFSTSCSVKVFKSEQCGYVGAGSICDRTYPQCKIYNNQINFRGFRWLEDMSDKRLDAQGS
jgi:hypothetical protein